MLLEVSCTVQEFMDFMTQVSEAGIHTDFDMHGADSYSSFQVNGQYPTYDVRPDDHMSSKALGNEEVIGNHSLNAYEVNDLFMCDGQLCKAVVRINPGDILTLNGNCVFTTLNEELKLLK